MPAEAPVEAGVSKRTALAEVGRNVVVAVIPVACLIGAKFAGVTLSGQLANWAIIVAVAWAAISLIAAFDPAYRAKINDIRSIASIIRGSDEKSG